MTCYKFNTYIMYKCAPAFSKSTAISRLRIVLFSLCPCRRFRPKSREYRRIFACYRRDRRPRTYVRQMVREKEKKYAPRSENKRSYYVTLLLFSTSGVDSFNLLECQ